MLEKYNNSKYFAYGTAYELNFHVWVISKVKYSSLKSPVLKKYS